MNFLYRKKDVMTKKWYESWFDSPYYHILYKDRDMEEAAAFIDKLIAFLQPPSGAKIMDLACGKGRHAFQLAEKGYDVTGLDLSPESIATAERQCHPNLRCAVHDMREPYKESYFDYIFSFFTSFGYFNDVEEDIKVLKSVWINLKPNGVYVMDFLNEAQVRRWLIPYEEKEVDGILFRISKNIEGGFVYKNIKFVADNHSYSFTERVRLINANEMKFLFQQANLDIIHIFGNYQLEGFDVQKSPRLILIAKKDG